MFTPCMFCPSHEPAGQKFISMCISNYIKYNVLDEIIFLFVNIDSAAATISG